MESATFLDPRTKLSNYGNDETLKMHSEAIIRDYLDENYPKLCNTRHTERSSSFFCRFKQRVSDDYEDEITTYLSLPLAERIPKNGSATMQNNFLGCSELQKITWPYQRLLYPVNKPFPQVLN